MPYYRSLIVTVGQLISPFPLPVTSTCTSLASALSAEPGPRIGVCEESNWMRYRIRDTRIRPWPTGPDAWFSGGGIFVVVTGIAPLGRTFSVFPELITVSGSFSARKTIFHFFRVTGSVQCLAALTCTLTVPAGAGHTKTPSKSVSNDGAGAYGSHTSPLREYLRTTSRRPRRKGVVVQIVFPFRWKIGIVIGKRVLQSWSLGNDVNRKFV